MIAFLIKHPIGVSMTFLGLLCLGMVAANYLPVSLVPHVDIPRITVSVNASNYSARQLENSIMSPLRNRLMQTNRIKEIKTESRNGSGLVILEFEHGTNIDLAYIEINEHIDRAMSSLPNDVNRPAVIKASASDIPVFYLNICFKHAKNPGQQRNLNSFTRNHLSDNRHNESENSFQELSEFADEIIRRRLEQLPQVAMADMSGRVFPEIIITPRMEKLYALNLPLSKIENVIIANNLSFGNIFLRDKQYRYSIRFGNRLLDAVDIGELYLNHQGRLWQLKDLCYIETRPQAVEGMVYAGDQRAITIAVIKQADARMQDLQQTLHHIIAQFETDYPELEFKIYRDQTVLLSHTIGNLQQTIIIGTSLAFMVMFLFLRDPRVPWLVIVSVPAALIVSMLCLHLLQISLNVISISGLVLCVGMMIDNAIIVTDNITRHFHSGKRIEQACIDGTNEVFRPLLSSVLTTCSVFIPLIFMGGLPGALFYDQAMAVTIGLSVSLIIAMTLLPVYYYVMGKRRATFEKPTAKYSGIYLYTKLYTAGFRFALRKQRMIWIISAGLLAGLAIMLYMVKKERLPEIQRESALLWIDWNENLNVDENRRRTQLLIAEAGSELVYSTLLIGRQQFALDIVNKGHQQSLVYMQATNASALKDIMTKSAEFLDCNYPDAIYRFRDDGNLFDQLFADRQAPLEIRLIPTGFCNSKLAHYLHSAILSLKENLPCRSFDALPMQQSVVLTADLQMLALHDVNMSSLERKLLWFFNDHRLVRLMDNRTGVPVKLGSKPAVIEDIIQRETVENRYGAKIPLNTFLRQTTEMELQGIVAGLEGEYFPLETDANARELAWLTDSVSSLLQKEGRFDASFSGSIYARRELTKELMTIGFIALALLFFILAAQFESLKLPAIILLEVPLSMAGALFLLILFGESLNLMSMTGMLVMAGIIINDSILKIDTINRLRTDGKPLISALLIAGHTRLKPILMTSITTITALLPFLFIKGLGGDLQKPLAISIIGGLGLGTLVSLFFIPVCYYYLCRNQK